LASSVDRALVKSFLEATKNLSQDEAAEEVGVSQKTISNWRRAEWSRLNAATRRALQSYLVAERNGQSEEERPEDMGGGGGAEDLFGDFDKIVRFLRRVGPPGQMQKRKEAAVRGLYDMLANTGGVPEWWYQLRDQVEAGEI
jgi:transcriptional regulator with XRE-family HTH domain